MSSKSSPDADADACLRNGLDASREQRTQEALTWFERAAALAPRAGLPHFLIGAEFAQLGRMEEAEAAYANAVLLAPALDMARFQLGLIQFTSGRAALALVTWGPLFERPAENALQRVVSGFAALAQDDFATAVARFREGMTLNLDNPALNRDLQMMIDRIAARSQGAASAGPSVTPVDTRTAEAEEGLHVLLTNYKQQGPMH